MKIVPLSPARLGEQLHEQWVEGNVATLHPWG